MPSNKFFKCIGCSYSYTTNIPGFTEQSFSNPLKACYTLLMPTNTFKIKCNWHRPNQNHFKIELFNFLQAYIIFCVSVPSRDLILLSLSLHQVCSPIFLISIVICSVFFLIFHIDHFQAGWQIYLSCFLLPFVGYFSGFLISFILRLPYDVCIAISVAVGAVNGPLAITVALHSFANAPDVVSVVLKLPTIYALFAPVEGIVWSLIYKTVDELFSKGHPALCGTGSV